MTKPDSNELHRVRAFEKPTDSQLARFCSALDLVSKAADGESRAVFDAASQAIIRLTGAAQVVILHHLDGSWTACRPSENPTGLEVSDFGLPDDAASWSEVRQLDGQRSFLPIVQGRTAAVLSDAPRHCIDDAVLATLGGVLAITIELAHERRRVGDAMDEVKVLQKVAARIFLSHEIEEILLTITHETIRLLDADICGVLLREDDQIVMKACAGNDTVDTARLRMRRGEGLAGRVFASGKPVKVDDYLRSKTISQDFFPLARSERRCG